MEEKKLPPLIDDLVNDLENKNAKVQFGLERQGHIPTIERILSEFGGATSKYAWKKIGEEIGWDANTAAFYYVEYLRGKLKEEKK